MKAYFALRSYRDGGEHYDGQVGSEPTPQAFLEALWAVMSEAWRILKPTGSCFINLGDKRSGSGGHNNSNLARLHQNYGRPPTERHDAADDGHRTVGASRRNAPDRYNQAAFGRPKSKMLLPHRFAIGCEDGLADPDGVGWIVRQDIVWSKPNGLPESVTDRVRDSHEYWFHLTKTGRYFAAVDEIRTEHAPKTLTHRGGGVAWGNDANPDNQWGNGGVRAPNPLGALPGSVWTIASEPLTLPDAVKAHYDLPDHFAAFPSEWPRRLILGWSPSGVCVACGEGRRPVVHQLSEVTQQSANRGRADGRAMNKQNDYSNADRKRTVASITGYACACLDTSAPTRPAVVIDPFGGTGTVAGVARQLGRTGVSFDLSYDYCRLAQWFLRDGRRFAKSASRTDAERQGVLL